MPPDNNVCAGNNQLVLVVNQAIRAYKASGGFLFTRSLSTLYGNPGGFFFDPVCRYDPFSSRWIIVSDYLVQDADGSIVQSGMYILVSDTADISSTYKYKYIEMKGNCGNGQCFADYPTIGLDKYGLW